MNLLKALLACSVLLATACANTIQSTSVSEAYRAYERQEYGRTLALITRAENVNATPRELKAELTYLKALAHGQLDQKEVALALYHYLAEQHKDSQYGYLAVQRLGKNRPLAPKEL